MLVLTRRAGEAVIVTNGTEELTIRVKQIRGKQVHMTFEAPKSMKILREEVIDRGDASDGA
jgi:carbon storage regulator CsrA